jgi:hypothetical protein
MLYSYYSEIFKLLMNISEGHLLPAANQQPSHVLDSIFAFSFKIHLLTKEFVYNP